MQRSRHKIATFLAVAISSLKSENFMTENLVQIMLRHFVLFQTAHTEQRCYRRGRPAGGPTCTRFVYLLLHSVSCLWLQVAYCEKNLFLRAIDGATQQNGTLNSGSAVDSVYWDVTLHCWASAFRRLEGKYCSWCFDLWHLSIGANTNIINNDNSSNNGSSFDNFKKSNIPICNTVVWVSHTSLDMVMLEAHTGLSSASCLLRPNIQFYNCGRVHSVRDASRGWRNSWTWSI